MRLILAQACALLALGAAACMSSNHDALAARPEGKDAGGGSSGSGAGGSSPADAASEEPEAPTDGAVADGPAGDAQDQDTGVIPDGPSVLTLIHGIADAPAIRVCFHAGTGGNLSALPVAPVPSQSEGLAFARSMVHFELPGGVDLATQDVRPVVYTGALEALGDAKCDALQPAPQGVLATAVQVIPAGSLSAGRSVLAVLAGCVGGPGHDSSAVELICGKGYSAAKPTATMLVATMTRSPVDDRIGLQAFGGSIASATLTLKHATTEQFTNEIAFDVAQGVIAPKPPSIDLSSQMLGVTPDQGRFNVYQKYQSTPAGYATVAEALARGGLSMGELVNGRNYTVVWVGAREGAAPGPWWMPFTVMLVRSDP